MRRYPRPQTDAVLAAIRECGPISRLEIEPLVNRGDAAVNDSLRILRRDKLIHISGYVRQEGIGGVYTILYAVGDKPDAIRPKAKTHKERNKVYRERNAAELRAKMMVRRGTTYNFWKGLM